MKQGNGENRQMGNGKENGGFENVRELDLVEMMRAMDGIRLQFAWIELMDKMGEAVFRMHGMDGETKEMRAIEGVILYHYPVNFFYPGPYAERQKAQPSCRSNDGILGVGNPGGACGTCPLNQFGSGEGRGKACRNKREVFLMIEGMFLPVTMTIQTGSLRAFEVYVSQVVFSGKRPSEVVTGFRAEEVVKEGKRFLELKMGVVRVLEGDEKGWLRELSEQIKFVRKNG